MRMPPRSPGKWAVASQEVADLLARRPELVTIVNPVVAQLLCRDRDNTDLEAS